MATNEYEIIINRILDLKKKVINKEAVLELSRLLFKVKEEKLYEKEFEFWDEFLHRRVGFNRNDAEKFISLGQKNLLEFDSKNTSLHIETSYVETKEEKIFEGRKPVVVEAPSTQQVIHKVEPVRDESMDFFEKASRLEKKLFDELNLLKDLKTEFDSMHYRISTKLSKEFNNWEGRDKYLKLKKEIEKML